MAQSAIELQSAARGSNGLRVKARVVGALIIRSLMEEHGRKNVGFLWIVITPLLLCSGVLIVRSLITSPIDHGVSLIAIIFSGYLPLTLFRHLSNGGVRLLQRNSGLFYHRPITALDPVLATIGMETISCSLAFIFVYWVLLTFGLLKPIADYGLVLSGWLLMAFLSSAIGCAFAVLTVNYERADRIIQPAQYLILPVCGFIFMTDWLPYYAQQIAWWMPTVHCYELLRAGMFDSSIVTHYDVWYPLLWGFALFAWSIPRLETARQKINFL
jgi:capsular polysaccharide transport system permease protein